MLLLRPRPRPVRYDVARPALLVVGAMVAAVVACSAEPRRGERPARTSAQPAAQPAARQSEPRPPSQLAGAQRIRQLDVGQGDAALLVTPEGRHVLIDAGPDVRPVADLLRAARVDTVDLVIASHNHADHIDGLPAVFASTVVRAYVENGVPATTSIYRRVLDAVAREPGIRVLQPTARTITVGSIALRLLPPARLDSSQNDNSVGVVVEYGAFRAVYTGDSERPALGKWLADGAVPAATVVKAAHHGSANGVTAAWVRATHPQVVLVSVGAGNTYGHPSAAVLRRWTTAGARVYRTDRDGEITIDATRDGRFTVRTARNRAP